MKIIEDYSPVAKSTAAALITDNVGVSASTGGGTPNNLLKNGLINDNHYTIAVDILIYCKKLFMNNVWYGMKREFVIPLKHIIINSGLPAKDVLKKVIASETPNEVHELAEYFKKLKNKLPKTEVTKKAEPIEPPKKKDFFKADKEVIDGKDFRRKRII